MNSKIKSIRAIEILDSRGKPTVEAQVVTEDGTVAVASVPSGASVGKYEAHELRDGENNRFGGKGVLRACESVKEIEKELIGVDAREQTTVDEKMLALDGTENKSRLGANAILSVSLAVARAAASSMKIPLYAHLKAIASGGAEDSLPYNTVAFSGDAEKLFSLGGSEKLETEAPIATNEIGGIKSSQLHEKEDLSARNFAGAYALPCPMMNILNGGAHASNNLDIQEFMIVPIGISNFSEQLRAGAEIYSALGKILKSRGYSTSVGDEGGFAPNLSGDEEAIELILEAVKTAGYTEEQVKISLDVAASEWASSGKYLLPKSKESYTAEGLIAKYSAWLDKYPIFSIEDGLGEDDTDGWQKMTQALSKRCLLVGDDLFVTNEKRLSSLSSAGCGNAILIKPNQIGTLSEVISVMKLADSLGYTTIISHRSGDTEDPFIADIGTALGATLIKSGAPCRAERLSKYNRLLRIEAALSGKL